MESIFKKKFPKLYDNKSPRIRLSNKIIPVLYKDKPLQWAKNGFIETYMKEK